MRSTGFQTETNRNGKGLKEKPMGAELKARQQELEDMSRIREVYGLSSLKNE
jgi:hypothetical protein